jgi:hypothetical protein
MKFVYYFVNIAEAKMQTGSGLNRYLSAYLLV